MFSAFAHYRRQIHVFLRYSLVCRLLFAHSFILSSSSSHCPPISNPNTMTSDDMNTKKWQQQQQQQLEQWGSKSDRFAEQHFTLLVNRTDVNCNPSCANRFSDFYLIRMISVAILFISFFICLSFITHVNSMVRLTIKLLNCAIGRKIDSNQIELIVYWNKRNKDRWWEQKRNQTSQCDWIWSIYKTWSIQLIRNNFRDWKFDFFGIGLICFRPNFNAASITSDESAIAVQI